MLSVFRPRSPLPPTPTAASSTTTALDGALKSFQDCLDPEQKAKLEAIKAVPDAHAVAEFTHQLDQENAKRKSRCVAARISPLLESIQQFSGVVETFVSSHPQVAALVWGSIKLVLQIASNFTTYFDKLSAFLMTIGKRCPRFQEYQKLYESSTDLQKALCDFYSVIVRCCEQAVGAIRRAGYIQMFKAIAGSFDSEFGPLLIQIDKSSNEVNETIRLVEAKLSTTERHDQRSERDESRKFRLESIALRNKRDVAEANRLAQKQLERRKIRQATKLEQLSHFNHRVAYWKARTQRHGSTGQWLTRTEQFMQWIAESSPSVFWFTGNLGSGKTVITGYVVESLSVKYGQSNEKLAYFFCQYDNEVSLQVTTILQSIIKQLLDQDDGTFTASERSIDALLGNPDDLGLLTRLLSDILDSLKSVLIVLDGIDECSSTEIKALFKTLRSLTLRASGPKLYLAGDDRVTDLVTTFLNPKFVASTHMPEAGSDLNELVQQLVDSKKDDEELVTGDPDLYQEVVNALCVASQGMILWVKFQLEELCLQKTDESIRLTLKHLPKDIFETYNRLLSKIAEEGNVELCNRAFQYVAAAKRPLSLDELGEIISLKPGQRCFMPQRLINDTKGIVRWCHGLIALHDLDDTLQFAHSSVKDFFSVPDDKSDIRSGFHFLQDEADRKLGEICATYLNLNDFKTQLIKAPRPQAFLDPVTMASQVLDVRSTGIVLNKAVEFMTNRLNPTPQASRLVLPRAIDPNTNTLTKKFDFYQYASQYWLSHTTKFSPDKGRMWNLFRMLAEERYPVLSDPNVSISLEDLDDRATALHDYMFSNQHQALFRLWMAQKWQRKDLTLTLALILRWECFSFIRLLPPLAKHHEPSWLSGVPSLEDYDLDNAMRSAGTDWMRRLALTERSELLVRIAGAYQIRSLIAVTELLQLDIDPFYECNNQGRITTPLEELIRGQDVMPLKSMCKAMLESHADFERKIAHPGRTALHIAADLGKSGATSVLVDFGALVNATDDHGQTPLHLAAQGEGPSTLNTIHVLLESGASTGMKDMYGKLALDYASGGVKGQISGYIRSRA